MTVPKFAQNYMSLMAPSPSNPKYAINRIMFRKGGSSKNSATGSTASIDEDNLSVPKRYHRQYLQQEEVDFVNSGGASRYDVLPKPPKKQTKGGGAGKNITATIKSDSKGPLDEENLDLPKRYHRKLLEQDEVDFVNTGGASKYDLIPKIGGKKPPASKQAKKKK